jgi:crotonobetainyl-CoA:carnitine CoA-transferase CaiB-like acyl-CoA transferase
MTDSPGAAQTPAAPQPLLAGVLVVELGESVAVAYAGRLLASLGADVVLVEPPGGNQLRRQAPFLAAAPDLSAVFAYLAADKLSIVCDKNTDTGGDELSELLEAGDVCLDDAAHGLGAGDAFPELVHVTIRPFGAAGPKATWEASEVNLIHASGEGFLLPNGLSAELFPDRPPLKIHGYFAEMQGGAIGALAALTALWTRTKAGGQHVDVSVQDAAVAVGAFALQRFGDGSVEHRTTRSFRYGGVVECADGFVEVLTLEDRQWAALVELMGRPRWAQLARYDDAVERGRDGAAINMQIRVWAATQRVDELVARAQALGLPMARYHAPHEVLAAPHTRARGTLTPVDIAGFGECEVFGSPFVVDGHPLPLRSGPPVLNSGRSWVAARLGCRPAMGGHAEGTTA